MEADPGNSLGGSCVRDVLNLKYSLMTKFNFIPSNIFILSSSNSSLKKIKLNHINDNCIKSSFINLENLIIKISKINPTLIYFHFTGHGYQKRDIHNDEKDNLDEYIKLSDGKILLDDDFYLSIKKYLKKDCKIRVSVDTCHAGTFSDFKYEYKSCDNWIISSNRESYFTNAYSIGGCSDNQYSMCDIGTKSGFGGSLTVHLLDTDQALYNFLFNDPIKTFVSLLPIMKKLKQNVILLKD